jgi:hypothetical protein
MKTIRLTSALFFAAMTILIGDDQKDGKTKRTSSIVSIWSGTVPLQDRRILSVELELKADGSALWIERIYKNWGHHERKKHITQTTQEASYQKITRERIPGRTVAGREPFVEVTVVGLKVGDWKVDYGDRKGNSIMRFDKRYTATLFLTEQPVANNQRLRVECKRRDEITTDEEDYTDCTD